VIETKSLCKRFGNVVALDNLNMSIEPGDIYGYIGPNGAGKSTTMKILATLLEPTSGSASVCGFNVMREGAKIRPLVGYMPDYIGVYDDLNVYEYLSFFAAAFKIPRKERNKVVEGVLELTDLTGKKDALVDSLSRGMKQRLGIARVLVHDPKVLLLDEPASGLDPRARIEMRELLKELKKMGKTILVSSHILSELHEMCNKVGIIEKGKLIFSGTFDEIKHKIGVKSRLRIMVGGPAEPAVAILSKLPQTDEIEHVDGGITLALKPGCESDGSIAAALVQAGIPLLSLVPEQLKLEEAFLRLTQGVVQ
jgi:ABC-2 type transport system ATP-binding protein